MKYLVLAALLLPIAANAQAPQPPAVQALGQMLAEAQVREAQANIRAITAEQHAADLEAKLKAAEAKPEPAK